jgi:FlaA1/EpsC-like NDP-sugar epimerase
MKDMFANKNILITGGTGSLGKVLVHRLLSGEHGMPNKIIVFSRDEAKQHHMRLYYQKRPETATDEVIYNNFRRVLQFEIGDVRDYARVSAALRDVHVVVNAAALKQVPTCEYFPYEAVQTNINGAENIVRAIREHRLNIETVVGVSTDKACKPVNVMGMTKALQERVFISANIASPNTRFIGVRYGNVLASRGSVIPLFIDQIRKGESVTITSPEMTRFLLSLNKAVDTVFAAFESAHPGEIYIPRVPSARIEDLAWALIEDRPLDVVVMGIRPGEKMHEILISDEEAWRTYDRAYNGQPYYAIASMLPELQHNDEPFARLQDEYSSADDVMTRAQVTALLHEHGLTVEGAMSRALMQGELLG